MSLMLPSAFLCDLQPCCCPQAKLKEIERQRLEREQQQQQAISSMGLPPPPPDVSDVADFDQHGGLGLGAGGGAGAAAGGQGLPGKGMDLAQKLLEKMGWKEGDGLGKNRQGISSALSVQVSFEIESRTCTSVA